MCLIHLRFWDHKNQRCTASFRAIFQFSRPVSGMGVLLSLSNFAEHHGAISRSLLWQPFFCLTYPKSHGNQNMVEAFSHILSMNVSDFPKPTWDTLSELSSFRASQGSCLTTSLSPLSSPPWNSFMIGVRPIDDPFVTVYFDRWHRHHLVQALCDSMRELTVGVLSGWAKLNLFLWFQVMAEGLSTSINFHQLPSTSINFRQPQSSRSCLSLGIWFAHNTKAQLRGIFHNLKHEDSLKRAAFSSPKSLAHWYELK